MSTIQLYGPASRVAEEGSALDRLMCGGAA